MADTDNEIFLSISEIKRIYNLSHYIAHLLINSPKIEKKKRGKKYTLLNQKSLEAYLIRNGLWKEDVNERITVSWQSVS